MLSFKRRVWILLILFIVTLAFYHFNNSTYNYIRQKSGNSLIIRARKYENEYIEKAYQIFNLRGKVVELAQLVEIQGYKNPIKILVYMDVEEQKIKEIKILEEHETKDYGGYVKEEWFADRFKDKSSKEELRLVKVIAKDSNEIVAITGATITSSSVVTGVNMAIKNFNEIYKRRD